MSRLFSKGFLANLKVNTLATLVDNGNLRDLRKTDLEYVLVPNLIQKISILKE